MIDYPKVAPGQGRKEKHTVIIKGKIKMSLVDGCVDVCSSRRSASKLTCRTASRSTTTRVPPSATTAAVCCGACTGKASSVKVGSHFFCFCNVKQTLCCVRVTQSLVVSFLFFHRTNRLWHERSQQLPEESGQSLRNQPETTGGSSVSSLPGLHCPMLCSFQ